MREAGVRRISLAAPRSGRSGPRVSAAGEAGELRHALGHQVERLSIRRPDHRLRAAVLLRVVQGADLEDDNAGIGGDAGGDVSAAVGAEFARASILDISAGKGLRRALDI